MAESGSVVLVSNEGNARLTTTLPGVHIAIMGMELIHEFIANLVQLNKKVNRVSRKEQAPCIFLNSDMTEPG